MRTPHIPRQADKSRLLARLPRHMRPKLTAQQQLDLAMAHTVNLDEIARGRGTEELMWQVMGGAMTWFNVATMLGIGEPEAKAQLDIATRLIERYYRTGRVAFDGPDYQAAKDGLVVMDELARLVDRFTAAEAADLAEAATQVLADQWRAKAPAAGATHGEPSCV